MNYFALVIIVLVCGGAYYSQTIKDQRVAEVEQRLNEQTDQITALETDKAALQASLDAANAKLKAAETSVAVPAPPVVVSTPTPTPAAPPTAVPLQANSPIAATPPTNAPAVTVPAPSADQMAQGIVMIKGDKAEGTGFLVKTAEGPFVVTNLHVLSNNPHLKIQTSSGLVITTTGMKAATDRDLAMLSIQDGAYTYLPLAADVSQVAHAGDPDITPGNSQGGNVVLNTQGAVVGIGPDRVEFNNPIYHGNSGGPVYHVGSHSVVAVVTEAMKVDMSSDLDKTSFASRNSAIASSIRYFGLRLDTVPKWEPCDLARYQNETHFLDDFDKQSRALDAYLNASNKDQSAEGQKAAAEQEQLYESDDRIMAAHHSFRQRLAGTDTAEQIEALRELGFSLDTIADKDMDKVKNPMNFYTYDQQRAHDELAYRLALKKEIAEFSSDVDRIGNLPRTND